MSEESSSDTSLSEESSSDTSMSEDSTSNKRIKMAEESTDIRHLIDLELHDFAEISKKPTFMDHTGLIQYFFNRFRPQYLFIGAPSWFCKSSNMNMIKRFFEISKDGQVDPDWKKRPQYELFKDMEVVQKGEEDDMKNHLGAHPVVLLDFEAPNTFHCEDEPRMWLYKAIKSAFDSHSEFLLKHLKDESDKNVCKMWKDSKNYEDIGEENVKTALRDLCRCLYRAHNNKRVLVLIDECEAIIAQTYNSYESPTPLREISRITATIFNSIIEGEIAETMIQGVLLTGVSYIMDKEVSKSDKLILCKFLDDTKDRNGFQRADIIRYYGLYKDDLIDFGKKLQGPLQLSDDQLKSKVNYILNQNTCGYQTKERREWFYSLYEFASSIISEHQSVKRRETPILTRPYGRFLADHGFTMSIMTAAMKSVEIVKPTVEAINIEQLIILREYPCFPPTEGLFFYLLLEVGILTHTCRPEHSHKKWHIIIPNFNTRMVYSKVRYDE